MNDEARRRKTCEPFVALGAIKVSSDETAAIIGRMMLERKQLREQEVALTDELGKTGETLGVIGRKLRGSVAAVTDADLAALASYAMVSKMVGELKAILERIQELDAALERAGL